MIQAIWIRIAALLALAVLPILALQLKLQGESIAQIYALADQTGIRSSVDQHLGHLREEARIQPEREAEFRSDFAVVSETKRSLEAFFLTRESIHRDFQMQAIVITLSVLALCLVGSFLLSRGIVHRVQQLMAEKQRAADKLRDLNALENWQKVAKVLVHELRAPMTPIKLVATDLDHQYRRLNPEGFNAYLRDAQTLMSEQVEAIERMIEGFTAFAKLPNPEFKTTSLSDFLTEFGHVYGTAWGEGVVLQIIKPAQDVLFRFDPKLLRDLFFNLCKNAAEANGGQTRLTLTLRREEQLVRMTLHNTGVSVPVELADTLFNPYVSGKSGSNLGLGLAIARKIAFDHGGDLRLLSGSPESGVTFQLECPTPGDQT